mmetsp:Transcript_11576/g.34467  ORF Transcript_11576/g.34467 Transcript_11576/m.34467 type:complete len:281 (+) Transcript_11576:157-999(+)
MSSKVMLLLLYSCFLAAATHALAPPHAYASPQLDAVEAAVDAAVARTAGRAIAALDPAERESAAIASRLRKRLDAFARHPNCRRCWLQRAHCVCGSCPPLSAAAPVRRVYVVMHHKELLLAVDTAKLILAAFPDSHLVIGGLAHQPAEAEMMRSLAAGEAYVLFPEDGAASPADVVDREAPFDLVVLDGTWEQASKLARRLPGPRLALDHATVARLSAGEGRQLRPHPEKWREVSTLSALRHALASLGVPEAAALADYQAVADAAARRQLGPRRLREAAF